VFPNHLRIFVGREMRTSQDTAASLTQGAPQTQGVPKTHGVLWTEGVPQTQGFTQLLGFPLTQGSRETHVFEKRRTSSRCSAGNVLSKGGERARHWRQKLKMNPEKYAAFREYDRLRCKRNRQKWARARVEQAWERARGNRERETMMH